MTTRPPRIQEIIDRLHGQITETVWEDGVITGLGQFAPGDLEAMGEAERIRLGLEHLYRFVPPDGFVPPAQHTEE